MMQIVRINPRLTNQALYFLLTYPIQTLDYQKSRPDILGLIPITAHQHKKVYLQILDVISLFLFAIASGYQLGKPTMLTSLIISCGLHRQSRDLSRSQ